MSRDSGARAAAIGIAWLVAWPLALLLLGGMLLLSSGCAVAGPLPVALGQSESLSCEGRSRVEADGSLTCEGELRWVTGGPVSSGFAHALAGARETALRAAGAVVGVPPAP